MSIPWEQPDAAITSGFDPSSVTERSARRRTGDAGQGRDVVVPVYLRRRPSRNGQPSLLGLLVRLSPGGRIAVDKDLVPAEVADPSRFWPAVHRAADDPRAVASRQGWTRVLVGEDAGSQLAGLGIVLRSTDWLMLRAALTLHQGAPSGPQDALGDWVLARFLGRLDGMDETSGAGLWGRLALEVVSYRRPERLADTRSLRWHACWGLGGFPAGSAGKAGGYGGSEMVLDLAHQELRVEGRPFRVRTLPDWEREQAAYDLGLPPLKLMAWPVSPLPVFLGFFEDIAPAPPAAEGPQDAARRRPRSGR